jgi:hypothetical protein
MEFKNSFLSYLIIGIFLISGTFLVLGLTTIQNDLIVICAVSFLTASLISFFIYNKKSMAVEDKYRIEFDEESIFCFHPEKPNEAIKWKEISEVTALVSHKKNTEPFFWVLISGENGQGGCMFPLGAKNSRNLLDKILGFEGFNLSLWAKALQSKENKRFVVWKKAGSK